MRTITRLISVIAVALGFLAVAPVAAQADTVGCVTHSEFQRVQRGMTKAQVARIFDTTGHVTTSSSGGGMRDEYREYRICRSWGSPRWSDVSINFDNYLAPHHNRGGLHVYSKDAFILH